MTALLLKAGAPPDQSTGAEGGTPLWQAACNGNVGAVRLLLDAGANPGVTVGTLTPLDCARSLREHARSLMRSRLVDRRSPFVEDFDSVIVLLEQALAKRKPPVQS